jgi:hypothetical protein
VKRLGAVCALMLVLAPAARAGGDFVDLARGGGTLWFVGSFGVRAIDARTGAVTASTTVGSSYPLSVAVAGGAVWVAGVENGFVDGTLTRIDLRTHTRRVVLHVARGSVQYAAAGAGGVYALVVERARTRVVLVGTAGGLRRVWVIPDAGRIAADGSGCWVSTGSALIHLEPRGGRRIVLDAPLGDVVTGAAAVWLPGATTVTRIDERTGATRVLHTGPLHTGGFQHDVAVGAGALWTLDALRPALQRRDLASGRLLATAALPDIPDAVVPTPRGVWVGIAISHEVLELDPHTLRVEKRVEAG